MSIFATKQKPVHVLLVDDDEDERDIFEMAAMNANLPIKVDHVTTCDKEKLAAMPLPDFVFLDINMPNYDGFVWLKGIREKVTQPVPVIMYSTTRNPENVRKAYHLGANLFITKPDTSSQLSKILHDVLHMDWDNPVELAAASYASDKFHIVH